MSELFLVSLLFVAVINLYLDFKFLIFKSINVMWFCGYCNQSRLTGSEPQGQEEAACVHSANTTTGMLFTGTNAVKFPSTVTLLSWALPLSYYRVSTFLPCRINKPKMNELGTTIVKNQLF